MPERCVTNPEMQLKRVVLPLPFGPIIPTVSPAFAESERPFSTVVS